MVGLEGWNAQSLEETNRHEEGLCLEPEVLTEISYESDAS